MSDGTPKYKAREIEQIFPDLMQSCLAEDQPSAVAVACSGGPDSMAVTAMLNDWARARSIEMTALIVDHGLRENSSDEAVQVRQWLIERGIRAEILDQQRDKSDAVAPTSNIQARARALRFDLLIGWCEAHGVDHLVLGHHLDDQAETFLLRLARGSGVDGLGAMRPRQANTDLYTGHSLVLLRPLLDLSKSDLAGVLKDRNWPSVGDPSNMDPRFNRVRWRQMAPALAELGLDAERLAKTARLMARASDTLERLTDIVCAENLRIDDAGGWAEVTLSAFVELEEEVALRLLSRVLCLVSGQPYRPRLTSLESALETLRSADAVNGLTLHGCQIRLKRDRVQVFRELAAIDPGKPVTSRFVWDGRYRLRVSGQLDGLTIDRLGQSGWQRLRQAFDDGSFACEMFSQIEKIPALAREGAPALWLGDILVAAPSFGFFHPERDSKEDVPLQIEECHFLGASELHRSF